MKTRIMVIALLTVLVVMAAFQQTYASLNMKASMDAKETVSGDKYLKGMNVRNEGTVKGDLFFWGKNVISKGLVEGDIIGAAQDINIDGTVAGNVRVGAPFTAISGKVEKNITAFGRSINITSESAVEGSVTAFAASLDMRGKVKGRTIIFSRDIVLGGEFFGDVEINQVGITKVRPRDFQSEKVSLTVLPGARIHGVLKFKGANADIQKGAEVNDFQWTKTSQVQQKWYRGWFFLYIWKFIRLAFTTAVYFLIGLLLIRLFPAFTQSVADRAVLKPGNSIGVGLLMVVSIIGVVIGCIALLALSVIMSPALGIATTIVSGSLYLTIFYLAALPAALTIGSMMFANRSIQYRLGAGLIVLKGGLFILMLLAFIPVAGYVFSVLSVLAKLGIVLLGSGAIVWGAKSVFTSRNTCITMVS
jgi:hypothetical protein